MLRILHLVVRRRGRLPGAACILPIEPAVKQNWLAVQSDAIRAQLRIVENFGLVGVGLAQEALRGSDGVVLKTLAGKRVPLHEIFYGADGRRRQSHGGAAPAGRVAGTRR